MPLVSKKEVWSSHQKWENTIDVYEKDWCNGVWYPASCGLEISHLYLHCEAGKTIINAGHGSDGEGSNLKCSFISLHVKALRDQFSSSFKKELYSDRLYPESRCYLFIYVKDGAVRIEHKWFSLFMIWSLTCKNLLMQGGFSLVW